MSDWSHELQLQFVEALQSEPVIWDPKHANHKDKRKVLDAWKRIEAEIGKPVKELKSKRDSLMATYRGYCRKIAASIKSGASGEDVYRPVWFAFELMDQFLCSVYNCGTTINTEDVPGGGASSYHGVCGGLITATAEVIFNEDGTESFGTTEENFNAAIEDYNITSASNSEFQGKQYDFSQSLNTSSNYKRKREQQDKIEEDAYHFLKVLATKAMAEKDDCDIFGQLIASQLKKLNKRNQAIARNQIQNLLFDLEMQEMIDPSDANNIKSPCEN